MPGGLGLIFAGGHRAVVHLVIQQDFLLGQHEIALPGGVQRRVAVCIGPGQIYMVGAAFQFYQVPDVGVSLLQPVSRGSSTAIPAQNRAGSAFFNRIRFSGLWRMVFLLLVGGSAAFCTLKIKKPL